MTAMVNQSPVAIHANLFRLGDADQSLQGRLFIKNLNIKRIGRELKSLHPYDLAGNLSSDFQFDFSKKNIDQSWIKGTVETKGVMCSIPSKDIKIRNGDATLLFKKKQATLNVPKVMVNNQILKIAGLSTYFKNPVASFVVSSPELNLDQLIPDTPPGQNDLKDEKRAAKPSTRLPSWVNTLTADVSIKIIKGVFRSVPFQNLDASGIFQKNSLNHGLITLDLADGHAQIKSTADLTSLNKISYTIQPNISKLNIEQMAPIFKMDEMPLSGPISITGNIDGCMGCTKNNLASTKGKLKLIIKEGILSKTSYLGSITSNIFAILNVKGIFTGDVFNDLKNKSISFDEISTTLSLDGPNLEIDNFLFFSHAMNMAGKGQINIQNKNLVLETIVEPLGTLNKVIEFIPLIGKAAQKLTLIYLKVEGPLENPTILPMPTKKIEDFFSETFAIPSEALNSIGNLRDSLFK